MSTRLLQVTEELHSYIKMVSVREHSLLTELRVETETLPNGYMQISPDQGQFLALLVKLLGAKRTLEIGVFTGYSSFVVAEAMGAQGMVDACDVSEEYTTIARKYWQRGGLTERIRLHIGPAMETLDRIIGESDASGSYDFAFIDADKVSTMNYYERSLRLVRTGGLIAIDNVLRHGAVTNVNNLDEDVVAMRDFNAFLHTDNRVDIALLAAYDGLTLALKR